MHSHTHTQTPADPSTNRIVLTFLCCIVWLQPLLGDARRRAEKACEFPATRVRVRKYHAQGCDQATGEFVGV